MTDKRSDERKSLVLLADALFDDLLSTSDEDLLAEVLEAGGDPTALVEQMKSQFKKAVVLSRKDRMKAAKAGIRNNRKTATSDRIIDTELARRVLRKALAEDGVSMAARNETESDLTDEEVLRKYNDLIQLGMINPEEEH